MRHINISMLLFTVNIFFYYSIYSFLSTNPSIRLEFSIVFFFLVALCQHFFLNLVHICTHRRGSKNLFFNNAIGSLSAFLTGFTFADFSTTHLLHHKWTSNPIKDPDYFITTFGPVFTIPFKIFYHDYYFWTKGLWKNNKWINYLLTRSLQILAVVLITISGNINILMYFWLLPLLLVGFLNGFFLFYFPHYTTKYEELIRQKNTNSIHEKIFLYFIDMSRTYHEDHHINTIEFKNYFPVIISIWNSIKHKKTRKYPHNLKYTNIFTETKTES